MSANTVRRLLKGMKFSLRANKKRLSGTPHPDCDKQYQDVSDKSPCRTDAFVRSSEIPPMTLTNGRRRPFYGFGPSRLLSETSTLVLPSCVKSRDLFPAGAVEAMLSRHLPASA